eukprot:m.88827 g.88827  ORF g.88827 m.88827 type:complete len:228 (+) comp11677_c0_seq3:284-967(+)
MQLGAKLLASFVLTVGTLLTLESTMPTTAPLLVGACPGMYNQYVQSDSLPRGRAMCALLGTVGTPTEVFVRQYEFNVLSCVAPVSALMPGIIEAGGSVVLASSVNGILGIGETPYSCAKAALHPLAMNIATAYGKHGVNANAVAIGTVASPAIWKSALEADKEILNKIGARNPRAKVGTPEEAAHVMVWLTSKDSALINGSVIVADGGWSIAAGTCRADSSGSWFNT